MHPEYQDIPTLETVVSDLFYKFAFIIPFDAGWLDKVLGVYFPNDPGLVKEISKQMRGAQILFFVEKMTGSLVLGGVSVPVCGEGNEINDHFLKSLDPKKIPSA